MRLSDLDQYDFDLPPELVRKEGVEPRDAARLFVYDTATDRVMFDIFRNLAKYVPESALMVLNNTTVLPARLWLAKETGGKIEVFVLANEMEDESRIPALLDRKARIGERLRFPNGDAFEIIGQRGNIFFVRLVHSPGTTLFELLERYGTTPLPPYLKSTSVPEQKLRMRYQTIFARAGRSVAAPTASLHFTDEVFRSLDTKGIARATVTLDVGLGTFAPLREEHFETGKLHPEYVSVSEETAQSVNAAKGAGRSIASVGTTTTRVLESLAAEKKIHAYAGKTDIFIVPPYSFQIVDTLVTNFHLPQSSLLLLVDAFLRHKGAKKNILELYRTAIENKFSFYSFGDSMLLL